MFDMDIPMYHLSCVLWRGYIHQSGSCQGTKLSFTLLHYCMSAYLPLQQLSVDIQ